MFQGDEQGYGYEGVNLFDPTICKRIPTIKKLLERLNNMRVLLIRSPPMAGKTSLAQLLEKHLLEEHTGTRVFRISLLWMEDDNPEWTFSDRFRWLMGNTGWRQFVFESSCTDTILIVDEVQKLYKPDKKDSVPLHGGNEFWDVFKDVQQYSKLRIVAFASYGYCGAHDGNVSNVSNVSPFQLSEHNTWGLENMRFMRSEFTDYFERFCEQKLKSLSAPDKDNLRIMNAELIDAELIDAELIDAEDQPQHRKKGTYTVKNTRAVYGLKAMTDDEQRLTDRVLFSPSGINIRSEVIPNKGRLSVAPRLRGFEQLPHKWYMVVMDVMDQAYLPYSHRTKDKISFPSIE
ncbi:3496_t:CDS:2, partial [Paraglomus occultum]